MPNIYIIASHTPTLTGKVIRAVTRFDFNHISLCLDDGFEEIYSFARRNLHSPLDAGCVRENYDRLSLGKSCLLNVNIYQLEVDDQQYEALCRRVQEIAEDDEYMYNLISVLVTPFYGGFHTYKAYSCAEFVAEVLQSCGIMQFIKAPCCCTPADMCQILAPYLWYSGDLRYLVTKTGDRTDSFFDPRPAMENVATVASAFKTLLMRKLTY